MSYRIQSILASVLLSFLPETPYAAVKEAVIFHGTITKVSDGDTVRFRDSGSKKGEKDWSIRMVGIDAPEQHLPVAGVGMVGQSPWGENATDYLNNIAPVGSKVSLVSYGKDAYGRVLGKIVYHGQDVNLEMVRSGWAIPYLICEGSLCDEDFSKNQDTEARTKPERHNMKAYISACESARDEGGGIYNYKNPLHEMPFEFRLRMQERNPDKLVGDYVTRKLYSPSDYDKVDVCHRVFFKSETQAKRYGFSK